VNFLWESGDRIERDQMNACPRHNWIGGSWIKRYNMKQNLLSV
jgi:hypothetical protein